MGLISKLLGHQKERLAKQWLEQQEVEIIAQNFRCRRGEIDLIGLTSDQSLIFFEIKYRQNDQFGQPEETITTSQKNRIFRCAEHFVYVNSQFQFHSMRFDVLTFLGDDASPTWIKNAFGH